MFYCSFLITVLSVFQELKELAALAYRDTTEENREFWKSELSQAIRDIQKEYDSKVDQIRGDMEGFYNLKVGKDHCPLSIIHFLNWCLLGGQACSNTCIIVCRFKNSVPELQNKTWRSLTSRRRIRNL